MENNVAVDLKEVECEDIGWFEMAEDKVKWRAFANTLIEENHLVVASGFDPLSYCWEQRCSSQSLSCSSCEGSWWNMAAGWKVC
jgi:hypothetical protein